MQRLRAGKREREARKRHRRGRICSTATKWKWLKLGRKKMNTLIRKGFLSNASGGG
jgi:hypothetical protein